MKAAMEAEAMVKATAKAAAKARVEGVPIDMAPTEGATTGGAVMPGRLAAQDHRLTI
jgi:hypothetical protein